MAGQPRRIASCTMASGVSLPSQKQVCVWKLLGTPDGETNNSNGMSIMLFAFSFCAAWAAD